MHEAEGGQWLPPSARWSTSVKNGSPNYNLRLPRSAYTAGFSKDLLCPRDQRLDIKNAALCRVDVWKYYELHPKHRVKAICHTAKSEVVVAFTYKDELCVGAFGSGSCVRPVLAWMLHLESECARRRCNCVLEITQVVTDGKPRSLAVQLVVCRSSRPLVIIYSTNLSQRSFKQTKHKALSVPGGAGLPQRSHQVLMLAVNVSANHRYQTWHITFTFSGY